MGLSMLRSRCMNNHPLVRLTIGMMLSKSARERLILVLSVWLGCFLKVKILMVKIRTP